MMILVGIATVFGLVFGGYLLSGGSMGVMLHALPFEGMMVGGAAFGAFLAGNSFDVVKRSFKSALMALKGPKWKPDDYKDLLQLLHELAQTYKSQGVLGLDTHIENPSASAIFSKFPKIMANEAAVNLIIDAFRMVTMEFDDPHETEEIINRKLAAYHQHAVAPINAMNMVADGLPAIGIVAAVLGVIKTMSAVDQPAPVLGQMIGGALVGTFLGVFAAYCIVMPIAQKATQIEEHDTAFGQVIRDVIVAIIKGHRPGVCVEIGRGNIPPGIRPDYATVEGFIKKSAAA